MFISYADFKSSIENTKKQILVNKKSASFLFQQKENNFTINFLKEEIYITWHDFSFIFWKKDLIYKMSNNIFILNLNDACKVEIKNKVVCATGIFIIKLVPRI